MVEHQLLVGTPLTWARFQFTVRPATSLNDGSVIPSRLAQSFRPVGKSKPPAAPSLIVSAPGSPPAGSIPNAL